ncbi:leukocyte elastase inhibitor [Aedes aegypti]|uniref:Serpin domain-containing protein n=1 Tax=Aedes aegypti TaxID=7159 RepID=A0A1S4F2N4_AEDAE|nr:leukocyte elastase inhibitor [Aedes aegypti]
MKWVLFFAFLVIERISAELSEYTTSTTSFTCDFFKQAYNPAENVVISPVSIQTSLSMFYPFAGNKVAPVMQQCLYLPADKNHATTNLRSFLQSLNAKTTAGTSTFKMLSKVYHVDANLKPQVAPLFKESFGAEIDVADFHDQAKVAAEVNSWVNRATNGMIKDFMQADDVRVDNDLMLLNVVVLNASWEVPFSAADTESMTFHFVNGDHPVDMMFKQEQVLYANLPDHGCQAVELLYEEGTDLSMVIVLPMKKSSLENVVRDMGVALYEKINERLSLERVQLAMPKFTMRKKIDAQELLKNMGLTALFEELDLDLLERDKSRIGEIRQTTFIKVDERGTEGAAATETQAVGRAGYPNFYVDRPFLYLIRKRSTKNIIFIGHYSAYEQ